MIHRLSGIFFFLLALRLVAPPTLPAASFEQPSPASGSSPPRVERVVFLAHHLDDEQQIVLASSIAAANRDAVLVVETGKTRPYLQTFLEAYHPDQVIPVGSFSESLPQLGKRLGMKPAPVVEWARGPPVALWKMLFPQAERVVVCPAEPRGQLLQSACLAGVLQAPLFVTHNRAGEREELGRLLAGWQAREVLAVGAAVKLCGDLRDVRLIPLENETAVAGAHVKLLSSKGSIRTLVVANPADLHEQRGGMSVLAPWVALQHQAALLLTNDKGDNTEALVHAAESLHADALILVGGLKAIPMEQRPNPAPGKDEFIEMEPLTPHEADPFSYATGRLFHEDPAVMALVLARQRLVLESASKSGKRSHPTALVVSNPGGGLPFLEVFSKNTAREMANRGYRTTAIFEDDVSKDQVRGLLPQQDVFLWEGHHQTLVEDYEFPKWTEPLRPSLIFLQSCLALNEVDVRPLFQRGAVSVIGSSSRIYSGTGGAFTLAFFDAMLYDERSLGGSLRQAKNFLLAYSLLKEKRLGTTAKLGGANLRSSWAFTLWGDPTLRLPAPEPPGTALAPVHPEVQGNNILVTLPEETYEKVTVEKYQAQMLPNARLAGLLSPEGVDRKNLVPFVFAEVSLPQVPPDKTPRLRSRVPDNHWVFNWDKRRHCGYLLITPRPRDQKELRFHVEWDD